MQIWFRARAISIPEKEDISKKVIYTYLVFKKNHGKRGEK